MENTEHSKEEIEKKGHKAVEDELMPLEPAAGAAENAGPSEGEDLPEVEDHFVEENMFPSEPSDPENE